jgi:hypothetical protein
MKDLNYLCETFDEFVKLNFEHLKKFWNEYYGTDLRDEIYVEILTDLWAEELSKHEEKDLDTNEE